MQQLPTRKLLPPSLKQRLRRGAEDRAQALEVDDLEPDVLLRMEDE